MSKAACRRRNYSIRGEEPAPTFFLHSWKRERESEQTRKYGGNHATNDFYSGKASLSTVTRKFSVSRNCDVDDGGFYTTENYIQRDL